MLGGYFFIGEVEIVFSPQIWQEMCLVGVIKFIGPYFAEVHQSECPVILGGGEYDIVFDGIEKSLRLDLFD